MMVNCKCVLDRKALNLFAMSSVALSRHFEIIYTNIKLNVLISENCVLSSDVFSDICLSVQDTVKNALPCIC
jgi:hypothetical protein